MSALGNILWFLLGGFLIAVYYADFGLLMCFTNIGLPFAKAHWRLLKMSLFPFGTSRR